MSWNRAKDSRQPIRPASDKGLTKHPILLAAGGVGIAVGIGYCLIGPSEVPGESADGKRSQTIAAVSPSVPGRPGQGGASDGDEPDKGTNATAVAEVKPEMWMGHVVLKHTYTTNSNGRTSEFLYTDDGECHRINGWALDKHALKTATDQLLGMATADAGGPPMPIVDGLDDMFRRSLAQPVEIAASDGDDVRAMKERVNEARKAMKEMMDGGMTFAQVLREHETVANENIKIHDNAQAELEAIVASGDREGAQKYCNKVNLALQQMGVEEIRMPPTEAEKSARREERRRRMLRSPFD